MPDYLKVNIDGTLCQGKERFSTGLAFTAPAGPPTAADLANWAEGVRGLLAVSSGGSLQLQGAMGAQSQITKVRTYYYAQVGQPATLAGESVGGAISGSGTPNMPPQCSMVITLLTGLAGKSFRGRMYWPLLGGGISAGGTSPYVTQSLVTGVATLLGNIGLAAPGGTSDPAVVSVVKNAVTPVTRISIGDVVDTQRRRRDALVENRFFGTV